MMKKKMVSITILFAILLINFSVLAKNAQKNYVEDEVLVLIDESAQQQVTAQNKKPSKIEKSINGNIVKRIKFAKRKKSKKSITSSFSKDSYSVLKVKLPKGKTVQQAIDENWKKRDSRILKVEPNYYRSINLTPNDTYFSQLWGLNNTGQTSGTVDADIDAPEAWNITTGSTDVVVAVIDTGVDYTHPDLAGNMWVNTLEQNGITGIDDDGNGYVDDIYGYDAINDDGDPMDDNFHGTHCAGTIGAIGNNSTGVTGVCWNVKIMAVKFLGAGGSGTNSDAIESINYAVANGADILSNSYGGDTFSYSENAAIENARDNGVLFVAAAGNSGSNNDLYPHYPASYEVSNVIAVAATDHDDSLAYFSNYGVSTVELAAPGVDIKSTFPTYMTSEMSIRGFATHYETISGTSMATPHVSGAVALLLANQPSISLADLKTKITWGGDYIEELANKIISRKRLNVYKSLLTEDGMNVESPNGSEKWAREITHYIKWLSIGGGDTVDIYLYKGGSVYQQLADDVENKGIYEWSIPQSLPIGTDYSIYIDDGVNTDESDGYFEIIKPVDYFTHLYGDEVGDDFDLEYKSVTFTPGDANDYYTACIRDVTAFPVNPDGGTQLDYYEMTPAGTGFWDTINLSGGKTVSLYGTDYSSFYVNCRGFLCFTEDHTYDLWYLDTHFSFPQICVFQTYFWEYAPDTIVSYKQLSDRVVITWQRMPEQYVHLNATSDFQLEMFFDSGIIRMSWLNAQAYQALVGLSAGDFYAEIPPDFKESIFTDYDQCDPPEALDVFPEPAKTKGLDNTIRWETSFLTDEYYAECATDVNFNSIFAQSGWISGTSYLFEGMQPSKDYWYRVKARTEIPEGIFYQTHKLHFLENELTNVKCYRLPQFDPYQYDGVATLRGPTSIDTIGGTDLDYERIKQCCYNGYICNTDTVLSEIEFYLDIPTSTEIGFFVYECSTATGSDYTRKYYKIIDESGTGEGWYSSGQIEVNLVAGKYYQIGAGCLGTFTARDGAGNKYTAFGEAFGIHGTVYFNPPTSKILDVNPTSNYYYRSRLITYDDTVYSLSGTMVSKVFQIPDTNSGNWIQAGYTATIPENTDLTIDILDGLDDSVLIADINNPKDISGISAESLKLKANYTTTDNAVTPVIRDWWISYVSPSDTQESSWSEVRSSKQYLLPDYEVDGVIDMKDFVFIAMRWLNDGCGYTGDVTSWCDMTDLDGSGDVDIGDVGLFSEYWLDTVSIYDDFNDGNYNGWSIIDNGDNNAPSVWSVASGKMVQSANIWHSNYEPIDKLGTYAYYNNGFDWTDYQLSLDIRSSDNDALGVMFRYQDDNNYYRFSIDKERNYRRLVKCQDGVFTLLAQDTVPYTINQTYHVDITVQGNQIEVFIDGNSILNTSDNSFSAGSIALYSWANVESYFDNIIIKLNDF